MREGVEPVMLGGVEHVTWRIMKEKLVRVGGERGG